MSCANPGMHAQIRVPWRSEGWTGVKKENGKDTRDKRNNTHRNMKTVRMKQFGRKQTFGRRKLAEEKICGEIGLEQRWSDR